VCLSWSGELLLAGKRIGVAHGHVDADVRRLLKAEPDYLFTGHSHIAADRQIGPTRCVNPGALHRAREFSVAVLDLTRDDLRFLPVPR
jgi:predicted phosphodiesterase